MGFLQLSIVYILANGTTRDPKRVVHEDLVHLHLFNLFHLNRPGFIDKLDGKKSCPLSGQDPHFFDRLALQSGRERDADAFQVGMRPLECVRHRPLQVAVFNDDRVGGQNEREIAIFLHVVGDFHIMESVFTLLRFLEQGEERPKRAIHDLENLLTDSGLQQSVILVVLDGVIVGVVAPVLAFEKKVLPNRIQSNIVEILRIPTHFAQGFVFGFR